MAERKYVWYCEMDRFGSTYKVIGRTEEEARNAMIECYIKTFKQYNEGINPKEEYEISLKANEDEFYDEESAECYKNFIDELYVEKLEFGIVDWR